MEAARLAGSRAAERPSHFITTRQSQITTGNNRNSGGNAMLTSTQIIVRQPQPGTLLALICALSVARRIRSSSSLDSGIYGHPKARIARPDPLNEIRSVTAVSGSRHTLSRSSECAFSFPRMFSNSGW